MPTASKLDFGLAIDDSKTYALKGSTLKSIHKALNADRVIPGPGQTEKQTPYGRSISGGEVDAVDGSCPLGSFEDDTMLPGWFIGGGVSQLIEPGIIEPIAGRKIWIQVQWTAEEVDMVLQAGGTAGNISVNYGTDIPVDTVPNIAALSGTAYISLGGWDDDVIYRDAGCGNVNLSFCPGGYIKTRG